MIISEEVSRFNNTDKLDFRYEKSAILFNGKKLMGFVIKISEINQKLILINLHFKSRYHF